MVFWFNTKSTLKHYAALNSGFKAYWITGFNGFLVYQFLWFSSFLVYKFLWFLWFSSSLFFFHWCTKQILDVVPSKNIFICFCYTSLHLPKIWYQRGTGTNTLHYIKSFCNGTGEWGLGDGTKCKTCIGCPRMILCGPWKPFFLLQK